ncbi:GNAT family N-acetyltransferase [Rhizorhapis sp. SPR117]|uniref:GNAT family N-acetyltransferase n=1 Tax=Rhizorhapis sp. SPR117 TaxID=2912611 RepID=UPI001F364860|nr:GNAT family N-acetyltransferase [Rhizorhapis sp. SPR117]
MTEPFDAIRTQRCRISPLEEDDAEALQAITDASVTSHIHFLSEPFTVADARALIGSNQEHRFFGVWDSVRTDLRGVIGVHLTHDREIEVGYWFSTGARGKGLATEAVRAMVRDLAILHPERRIIAECHPDNRRSWALLERIGFTPTHKAGARPGRMVLSWNAQANYRIDVC